MHPNVHSNIIYNCQDTRSNLNVNQQMNGKLTSLLPVFKWRLKHSLTAQWKFVGIK